MKPGKNKDRLEPELKPAPWPGPSARRTVGPRPAALLVGTGPACGAEDVLGNDLGMGRGGAGDRWRSSGINRLARIASSAARNCAVRALSRGSGATAISLGGPDRVRSLGEVRNRSGSSSAGPYGLLGSAGRGACEPASVRPRSRFPIVSAAWMPRWWSPRSPWKAMAGMQFVKSGSYHGANFMSWTMRGQMYTIASADARVGCLLCHSTGAPRTVVN